MGCLMAGCCIAGWGRFRRGTEVAVDPVLQPRKRGGVPARAKIPVLELSGLTVRRGDHQLLRDVAWRIGSREHWVVLGPNGCGKTSLLKVLTGYMSPTAGELAVLGRRYGRADWRELRLQIGLVTSALQAQIPPAEVALDTVISGRYAQLDLWVKTTRADRATARRALREVGLAALADRPWLYLSQGERQRVLIARALVARPRLLILDEPCGGLDPVARVRFLTVVERLARRRNGPTLILVTHHVEEITPAFSHVLLMRAGRVMAAGPRERVLTSGALSTTFGVRLVLRRGANGLRLVTR